MIVKHRKQRERVLTCLMGGNNVATIRPTDTFTGNTFLFQKYFDTVKTYFTSIEMPSNLTRLQAGYKITVDSFLPNYRGRTFKWSSLDTLAALFLCKDARRAEMFLPNLSKTTHRPIQSGNNLPYDYYVGGLKVYLPKLSDIASGRYIGSAYTTHVYLTSGTLSFTKTGSQFIVCYGTSSSANVNLSNNILNKYDISTSISCKEIALPVVDSTKYVPLSDSSTAYVYIYKGGTAWNHHSTYTLVDTVDRLPDPSTVSGQTRLVRDGLELWRSNGTNWSFVESIYPNKQYARAPVEGDRYVNFSDQTIYMYVDSVWVPYKTFDIFTDEYESTLAVYDKMFIGNFNAYMFQANKYYYHTVHEYVDDVKYQRPNNYGYKIVYEPENGAYYKESISLKGAPIEAPEVPTKEGYTFLGWYPLEWQASETTYLEAPPATPVTDDVYFRKTHNTLHTYKVQSDYILLAVGTPEPVSPVYGQMYCTSAYKATSNSDAGAVLKIWDGSAWVSYTLRTYKDTATILGDAKFAIGYLTTRINVIIQRECWGLGTYVKEHYYIPEYLGELSYDYTNNQMCEAVVSNTPVDFATQTYNGPTVLYAKWEEIV